MSKRIFISYEYDGDRDFVNGIRGMVANANIDLDFYDESVNVEVNSTKAEYIKQKIGEKIKRSGIILAIVGRDTHTSKWVEWEINYSKSNGKKVVFMRRKGIFNSNFPERLREGQTIYNWDINKLIQITS